MKKALLLITLICTALASAQIKVTKEGYPKFENKQPTTTVSATDTLMISKVDGIQMGISFSDFTNGIGGGTTYTAGNGIDITSGVISADESYLDGVYLPLDGSQAMQDDLDLDFNDITDVNTIVLQTLIAQSDVITPNLTADGINSSSLSGVGNRMVIAESNGTLSTQSIPSGGGTDDQTASEVAFTPYGTIAATNTQSAIQELLDEASTASIDWSTPVNSDISFDTNDTYYIGNSGNYPIGIFGGELFGVKGVTTGVVQLNAFVNGTLPSLDNDGAIRYNFNTDIFEGLANGVVVPLSGTSSGSTSLTRYHSINEITSDITASYSNQVTGSGYGVVNTVSGSGDYVVTINNLRSSLVNENYSFVSNSSGSTLELVQGTATFVGKGQDSNNAVRITDYGNANLLEISDGVFRVDGDFEWFTYAENLILNGTQGSGTGSGATGGTHPGMTNSGTIPTYIIADDGSSAFDFNRYVVSIPLAANGLSAGDTLQIEMDAVSGGTAPRIQINFDNISNNEIATIQAGTLSDSGVIPSGVTDITIWFLPNYNSTNNTTATFTNVSLTKL